MALLLIVGFPLFVVEKCHHTIFFFWWVVNTFWFFRVAELIPPRPAFPRRTDNAEKVETNILEIMYEHICTCTLTCNFWDICCIVVHTDVSWRCMYMLTTNTMIYRLLLKNANSYWFLIASEWITLTWRQLYFCKWFNYVVNRQLMTSTNKLHLWRPWFWKSSGWSTLMIL